MIGILSRAALAPMDYRYALDAAMPLLAAGPKPLLLCGVPQLADEARQRLPHLTDVGAVSSALWIEPDVESWEREIAALAPALPGGAPLVVIASRPLARLLPERRAWKGRPLGMRPGGVGRLCRALPHAGFAIEANHGIHSMSAIALNLLGRQCERWGRSDLGDRLQFAARLRYCVAGPLAPLSTTALLVARKGENRC